MCIRDSIFTSHTLLYFTFKTQILKISALNILYILPVSYTHLDVYKRQVIGLFCIHIRLMVLSMSFSSSAVSDFTANKF